MESIFCRYTRFAAPFAFLLASTVAFSASAQTVELLFYSTVPRNLSEPMLNRFTELNPNIKVSMFQAGVETLLGKLKLEIRGTGRMRADVVWIQEPSAIKELAEEGRLEPNQSKELDQILSIYKDPKGRFVANQVGHVFLVYNTNKLTPEQAPKSWKDLTDSRFSKQLIFANPRISGTGAMVVNAMVQTYGWGFWEAVAKLKPVLVGGSQGGIPSTIIQGERLVGPLHDYTITALLRKGEPVGYVVPTEGGLAQQAHMETTMMRCGRRRSTSQSILSTTGSLYRAGRKRRRLIIIVPSSLRTSPSSVAWCAHAPPNRNSAFSFR